VAGHLRIGAGARVGAQAGVMADVPAGAEYAGSPAQPARDAFRQIAALRRLAGGRRGRPATSTD
jgi:UDP-3-O-[3-hydroxymyristoyl] glucosamine N-acyltransferase